MNQFLRSTGFSHALAAHWPSFVDCPKRLITEAPFLQRITENFETEPILDACAGIGCESIYLRSKGLEVISNEIDPDLRAVASGIASSQRVRLRFASVDWRSICDAFPVASFETILLMGNSLGLLGDLKEIADSLRQMYALLRPGGKLVLDQRNYDYILNSRESILRGDFRYSGRYVYCGDSIIGRPLAISEAQVVFGYFTITGSLLGELTMIPLRPPMVCDLLHSAGFSRVDKYYDFAANPSLSYDFMTFVANRERG